MMRIVFATPCSLELHPFQSIDTSGLTPCPPNSITRSPISVLLTEFPLRGSSRARGTYPSPCFVAIAVLPDQDRALPDRAVPQLDEGSGHPTMLVVSVPIPDSGAPLQGVP